jgi:hypothetical protein
MVSIDDGGEGKRLYRFMMEPHSDIDTNNFTENVSISWQFSEEGFPDKEMSETLRTFEHYLKSMDDPDSNSFLVFAYTGYGKREWSYQAKNYESFMQELNDNLADKPQFPISIEHSHDPDWEYYNGVKEVISEENT